MKVILVCFKIIKFKVFICKHFLTGSVWLDTVTETEDVTSPDQHLSLYISSLTGVTSDPCCTTFCDCEETFLSLLCFNRSNMFPLDTTLLADPLSQCTPAQSFIHLSLLLIFTYLPCVEKIKLENCCLKGTQ